MSATPFKYNPGVLGDEELVRSFVVRHSCLGLILEALKENAETRSANRHLLLVGPRGIGKTMLVRRVVAEIRSNSEFGDQWFPLVFGEESYQVSSAGEFWLEALSHLSDESRDRKWAAAVAELRQERSDSRLRERALAQLVDFADAQCKRLLLVVENLNMLTEQISSDATWELRHTLNNEPRLMLLGTATLRFDAIDQADQAWYELFAVHELKPLDRADSQALWRYVARQHLKPGQVRAIRILTGGNPRLLTILAGFAANRSFQELMEQLVHLIDEHTEYFKGHLDALPPKERKVFVALLEQWNPATAGDLARAGRMEINEVSSMLKRLEMRGAVELFEQRPRRNVYQAAERLYNIYYLMRRRGQPADRVRAAVSFMVMFYGGAQLASTIADLAREACDLPLGKTADHYLAYTELLIRAPRGVLIRALDRTPPEFFGREDAPQAIRQLSKAKSLSAFSQNKEIYSEAIEALRAGQLEKAEQALRKIVAIDRNDGTSWGSLGFVLGRQNRLEESEQALCKSLAINPTSALVWQSLGDVQQRLGRPSEAEQSYRKAIEVDPKARCWAHIGSFFAESHRVEEAEEAYRSAIKLDPKYPCAWHLLGNLLQRLGRPEEAEQMCKKAVEVDPKHSESWRSLGIVFDYQGRREEAEKAFNRAIELDPKGGSPWNSLGVFFARQDRHEEAKAAYQKAVELNPGSAKFWSDLGHQLSQHGLPAEAERVWAQGLQLNPSLVSCSVHLLIARLEQGAPLASILREAETWIVRSGRAAGLLCSMSRFVVGSNIVEGFSQAEMWAREAWSKEQSPDTSEALALSCAAQRKWNEALESSRLLLDSAAESAEAQQRVTGFLIRAAAAGHAREALGSLVASRGAAPLEPLLVGLRVYLGEAPRVAKEILEIAEDVAERIREAARSGDDLIGEPPEHYVFPQKTTS